MVSNNNPLFTSTATQSGQRAAKIGGYGGIALAAWLVASVATGHGVAAADTVKPSEAGSSSTSSAASGSSGEAAGSAQKPPSEPMNTSAGATPTTAAAGGDPTSASGTSSPAAAPKPSGSASSSNEIAPGVTVSSSGGTHKPTKVKSSKKAAKAVPKATEAETVSAPKVSTASMSAAASATAKSNTAVTAEPVTPTITVAAATNALAAAAVPAATARITSPAAGVTRFLNSVVTHLLNPFLKTAPDAPEPFTPAVWAVLAWVRRNVFNQAPTVAYNPTTTVQTGQTLTGNLGATDAEGDALTYKVTKGPKYGTLNIDQATGSFTYTPADIDYDAAQTDSFSVSVSDGKANLLSLFTPHTARESVQTTVLNPTVQRVILDLPDTIASPANPRYSADGKSIFFAGQPTAGGRSEIYQVNADGTNLNCVSCGVATNETGNLMKPVPVDDGSGRVLVLVQDPGKGPRYSVLEDGVTGRQLIPVTTPPGGGFAIDPQREMRVSPDGTHVLFTRIVLGPNNLVQALPIVGTLVRTANGYEVDDARVVYPTGEGKQWTPDGKGVVILGGAFEAGNVDDIEVDLATGTVNRVTANLDYDEDMDFSPNQQWIAIGSTRGLDALTPMTRIIRPNFLPAYVSAPVYDEYALPINVSNQEWIVALDDELKRENGIPLFDTGDGYAARSMPSWNPTGEAITFWESSITDPTVSRLVIANLKYTTSVGPVAADRSTPSSDSWAPQLSTYVATTTPLPPVGTHAGVGGGTAVVSEAPDPADATRTVRTVVYTNYVNEIGEILNGTESADYNAGQTAVHYLADITVTGAHTGYLKADATVNAFQQSLTGFITSSVDGDVQSLPNPAAAEEAQQNA